MEAHRFTLEIYSHQIDSRGYVGLKKKKSKNYDKKIYAKTKDKEKWKSIDIAYKINETC